MNKISITQAKIADVPEILNFIRRLAEYEKLAHEVIATEDLLAQNLFGKHPTAEVIFAQIGDQRLGMALFFHSFSTFLGRPGIYLEDLFVLPEARGQGIGKMLLQHLARLAKERGCGRLEWAVLDWNQPAIDFYEGLNAQAMSEWVTYRLTGQPLNELADITE